MITAMGKLDDFLKKQLRGQVFSNQRTIDYFSTDGSVFRLPPKVAYYPTNAKDVAQAARVSWQLAENGKRLPITARGRGTDQAGGALGEGLMMVFPPHMNKLKAIGKDTVTVQPGLLYDTLQTTLKSHGRFLPPFPSSIQFSTIGGAVANNACGEKTIKYGSTRDYVKSLNVVLANGEHIVAERISKRELNHKKGLTSFEGEVYRKLDGLLLDNKELIEKTHPHVSKNSAGYALWEVKGKDGSFDLSKLIVGSQGTLGLVTEATLKTEPFNPSADLLTAFFDDLDKAGEAVVKLKELGPSAMELVDIHLLEFLEKSNPSALVGFEPGKLPKLVLLIEFDDAKQRVRDKKAKKAHKILTNLATERRIIPNHEEQEADWMMRHSVAAIIWQNDDPKKALPIIEDGVVPVERFKDFLDEIYALFKRNNLEIAIWGHAGDANFHLQPFLDLSLLGDRQKVFKIMDEFYKMVIDLGGSTAGEHNDGRLRGPYLRDLYGAEMYRLFKETKQIFDPYNILNPGVKIDVDKKDVIPLLREEYSMKHLYDHMPYSG